MHEYPIANNNRLKPKSNYVYRKLMYANQTKLPKPNRFTSKQYIYNQ